MTEIQVQPAGCLMFIAAIAASVLVVVATVVACIWLIGTVS